MPDKAQHKTKILIAAGGTGGHLFPAQSLAKELLVKDPELTILFAGAGLSTNRYFHKEIFNYKEVSSGTPFRGNIFLAGGKLALGVRKSLKLLDEFEPNLVIGFGSFHSFPLLAAAVLRKIPFLLFEANAIPGKVNRFFSRWANVTAVHFAHATAQLSGKTQEVAMPLGDRKHNLHIEKTMARAFFGLDPKKTTLLVFGGSQGALSINKIFSEAAGLLFTHFNDFQVIHLTGHREGIEQTKKTYSLLNIPACIKEFEENMAYAWRASDLAICRSGAATLAELIALEVPAILIPYPRASDDHQRKNAEIMENEVKGARVLLESELNAVNLYHLLHELIATNKETLDEMRKAISQFRLHEEKGALSELVWQILGG
jgi:UDP-N-acetylglucosamine--N-acetylmuramyl-(pentapeptide) pyrophosphoryl-undecaprenol N-acetylglucosamine transferase